MKLSGLRQRFPWEQTREVLCREAPRIDELRLEEARLLIAGQRDSQLPALGRLMDGPLLDADYAREKPVRETAEGERPYLQLRDPRQASRLLLGLAAQVGTALVPFGLSRLAELDRADGAHGRLLLLLAVAESSSPQRREELAGSWSELGERWSGGPSALPFGPVLTPMLDAAAEGEPTLGEEPFESLMHLVGGIDATTGRKLATWTRRLVREGASRIVSLSGGGLGHPSPSPEPRQVFSVDILLRGDRERNAGFLEAVTSLPGVEPQSRFIEEEDPALTRLRIWSAMPVKEEELRRLAERNEAVVVEFQA